MLPLATGALLLLLNVTPAWAQFFTLANPHWNITLTDAGYSDFLIDNTPGFEGREYLSGEWGAAVGYQVAGGAVVAPQWLERQFSYPDWVTASTFTVVTPIAQVGLNADSLPIAQSQLANSHLEVTLRHEMVDTVVGTPMGLTPASVGGAGREILSSRYALKQTITLTAKPGPGISHLELFQFLHGLQSQRGVYDDRPYPGTLGSYRYDVTLAGVDAWAAGNGSSSAGLEDFIGFHAAVAPSAFEIGHYGIEGNGVDDHWSAKPSTGVHLSVEDNWLTPPYSSRVGTDEFAPAHRWLAGAQRWTLGSLSPGQSVSIEILLTVRTGTRVVAGPGSSGGCNGGSTVPGGIDYEFDDVSDEGSCFGDFTCADDDEIAVRIAAGEFGPLTFPTPGGPTQLWDVSFSGVFSGKAHLTVAYDPTLLPAGLDEDALCLYEYHDDAWHKLAGAVDATSDTIAVSTPQLGPLALAVDLGAGASYSIGVAADPAEGGTVEGGGAYAAGSLATVVASPSPGFVFSQWTEGGSGVSTSPTYTFAVPSDRTLIAHFAPAGAAKTVVTRSTPAAGGTTSGDGAYAPGTTATVVAVPHPGYKFSKWLVNEVAVSTSASYSFTVTDNRTLVAKFKPVYTVTVEADPLQVDGEDFEVEGDGLYEPGEIAKMKAKTLDGYSFVNWTQNGVEVSTDPLFQFTVGGNRHLVGHFAPGHRIDASAIPPHAGTIDGAGVSAGPVTLTANPEPGYVFLYWELATDPGVPLAEEPAYTFTPDASLALIANFGLAPVDANEPPSGSGDDLRRFSDSLVAKVLKSDLLANDSDAEGDPLTLVSVGDATPPGATVTLAGNYVVYTAPAKDAGNGQFVYVLSDGPGGHLVDVTVTVTQTDPGPADQGANAVEIRPDGPDYIVTFLGVPGHSYRVQYTESVSPPTWTDLPPAVPLVAPANGAFRVTDPQPPSPVRFYRAIPAP